MKKIIMTVVAVTLSIAAQAQCYIGGSFSFDHNKINSESARTYTINIEPTIGFCLNDLNTVELNLTYSSAFYKDNVDKVSENNYGIGSTYRYCIPLYDALSYNVYGGVGVGFNDNGFNKVSTTMVCLLETIWNGLLHPISQ